jgi:hypothetical protein
MITIRPEQSGDITKVREINEAAFGRPTEASIVDSRRNACPDAVAFVAVEDERILDHIILAKRGRTCFLIKEGLIYQTFRAAQGRAAESVDCKSLDS